MLQKTVGGCCSLLTWITKILNLRIFGTKFATADVFFTWAATASQKNKAVDSRSLNQKSVPATISEINRCHVKTSLFCQEINIQILNIYLECQLSGSQTSSLLSRNTFRARWTHKRRQCLFTTSSLWRMALTNRKEISHWMYPSFQPFTP